MRSCLCGCIGGNWKGKQTLAVLAVSWVRARLLPDAMWRRQEKVCANRLPELSISKSCMGYHSGARINIRAVTRRGEGGRRGGLKSKEPMTS
ncbi:hypothetical protein J6590_017673 [Homalodisca vitripennis]|nr:hypothetical protein J6590_017673 [Homalodisca vitripennis]